MNLSEQDLERIKAGIEAEYRKDIDAIERVFSIIKRTSNNATENLVGVNNVRSAEVSLQRKPPFDNSLNDAAEDTKKIKRTSGVKHAGESIFKDLPVVFSRLHIMELLRRDFPEIASRMSPKSIRGIAANYIEKGWCELASQGSGNNPSIYKKNQQREEEFSRLFENRKENASEHTLDGATLTHSF